MALTKTTATLTDDTESAPSMKLVKGKKAPVTEAVQEQVEAPKVLKQAVDTSEAESLVKVDETDLIQLTVNEVNNMERETAIALVPQLMNTIDHDYFRLGGILATVQQKGWALDGGYENFRQYVESEAGIQYRKAMYLVGIYNGLSASGVAWSQVKGLGWTMLKELASILTPENVDEWVEIAKSMTVMQVQEYIKTKSAGANKVDSSDYAAQADVKKTSTITFKVHQDQKDAIREALDKNKHESGTEFDAVALENICIDYLAGDSKLKGKKAPTLLELLKGLGTDKALEVFAEAFPDKDFDLIEHVAE